VLLGLCADSVTITLLNLIISFLVESLGFSVLACHLQILMNLLLFQFGCLYLFSSTGV
jgi:hypothetical protein